jgi:hypothetical protein
VKQSPVGKDMNTEAGESTSLKALQAKITVGVIFGVVTFIVRRSVKLLYLFVVTTY